MQFLVDNSVYVTLVIATMITIGLFLYLNRIDARLRTLERQERNRP